MPHGHRVNEWVQGIEAIYVVGHRVKVAEPQLHRE
jgi:hypothetical protein